MYGHVTNDVVSEGGAAGHLSHLWDNRDLTFLEIKEVLSLAAEGKLEKVSEKMDGVNLVFTYDPSKKVLKAARNGGDLKTGGMTAKDLATKFEGRGNIAEAFNTAFKVLKQAIKVLPEKAQTSVFGKTGSVWYSIEILYSKNPGTISYDSNNIVFHGSPIFKVAPNGSVSQVQSSTGVDTLTRYIESMQKAVTVRDWQVKGPALVRLKKLSDGSILRDVETTLGSIMQGAGITDADTVGDYLREMMMQEIQSLKLPPGASEALAKRATGDPNAPTFIEIKKSLSPEQKIATSEFYKKAPVLMKKFIEPLEIAIQKFAIEVLRGLASTLMVNPDAEVMRLRDQLNKAISAIEASGNEGAMSILKTQMARLGNVENVAAAMEGVVFMYKGNAYKFTGAFAPAHQILSLFKYGRGNVKLNFQESKRLQETLNRVTNKWQTF